MRIQACSLLAAAVLLTGCDDPKWCLPCADRREVRDIFCGCFNPKERDVATRNLGVELARQTSYAKCICDYSDGTVGAWYNYKPGSYGTSGTITVTASTCEASSYCERRPNASGYSYTYLTGTYRIKPSKWTEFLVSPGGYGVLGKLERRYSEAPAPVYARLAANLSHVWRSFETAAIGPAGVRACSLICSKGSANCQSIDVPKRYSAAFRALYRRLDLEETRIASQELRTMFNTNDPCGRSDTTVKDGNLRNEGAACTLTTSVPSLDIDVSLEVPAVLQSRISRNGTSLVFEIGRDDAPKVSFSDDLLNKDWGGSVVGVLATQTNVFFQVGDASCIKLAIDDP